MSESSSASVMSLAQFEECLMDGERWVELIEGRFVRLDPPDDAHGDVIRNLSKPLAAYFKRETEVGICSFELPLVMQQDSPTVRCPAISFFKVQSENRFSETNRVLSERKPFLVIEVASTNDRRRAISDRVKAYLNWGVAGVWIVDPTTQQVHQFHGSSPATMVKSPQVLLGHPLLPGFSIPVSDLFRQPDWMKK